jgi:hypothetical protein
MRDSRNHNAFVFMTTLSVCLGLVLVTSAAPVSAQTSQSGNGLRVMVRQSLYGNAIEDLFRELERLGKEGDALDLEKELALLDTETLLTIATLQDFVSDLRHSEEHPALGTGIPCIHREPVSDWRPDALNIAPLPLSTAIPLTAFARASLDDTAPTAAA